MLKSEDFYPGDLLDASIGDTANRFRPNCYEPGSAQNLHSSRRHCQIFASFIHRTNAERRKLRSLFSLTCYKAFCRHIHPGTIPAFCWGVRAGKTPSAGTTKEAQHERVGAGIHTDKTGASIGTQIAQLEASLRKLGSGWAQPQVERGLQLIRKTLEEAQTNGDVLLAPRMVPEALLAPPYPPQNGGHETPPVQLPLPLSSEMKALVQRWDFDLHTVPRADLAALSFGVLLEHEEVTGLKLCHMRLWKFVLTISTYYHDNPFHNFRHACDVLLASSCLVRLATKSHPGLLSPLQVAAQLIAALVHDTDHPGVMNPFLVNTRHPLAVLYNGKSVLENHHAATSMALLARPDLDFTINLPADDAKEMKKLIVDLVLATDVTTTMPFVKGLSSRLSSGEKPSAEDVQLIIIKASDISNPTRPLSTYEHWIKGVVAEFYAQGDVERKLGLPISMNCDRETVVVSKCQVGFISFLVQPLFECLATVLPDVSHMCIENLLSNKAHFAAQ